MKNDKIFSIEHFDILDNGSQEIEVKCSSCGKECNFPFMTLIRREDGESIATYREFCSHSCFIDWLLSMAPKLSELRESMKVIRANKDNKAPSEKGGSAKEESSKIDD